MDHATMAGDSTFVRPSRTVLQAQLDQLRMERLGKEMSDDFAYTNGSIARIDRQIAQVRAQLAQIEQVAA